MRERTRRGIARGPPKVRTEVLFVEQAIDRGGTIKAPQPDLG
jgi:hypothetical protein